jgi:hypothetical protein
MTFYYSLTLYVQTLCKLVTTHDTLGDQRRIIIICETCTYVWHMSPVWHPGHVSHCDKMSHKQLEKKAKNMSSTITAWTRCYCDTMTPLWNQKSSYSLEPRHIGVRRVEPKNESLFTLKLSCSSRNGENESRNLWDFFSLCFKQCFTGMLVAAAAAAPRKVNEVSHFGPVACTCSVHVDPEFPYFVK